MRSKNNWERLIEIESIPRADGVRIRNSAESHSSICHAGLGSASR